MDAMKICWGVLWFLILWFIGFWISSFFAMIYVLISVFAPCIPGLEDLSQFMLKGVQFAGFCSKMMVQGTPINEAMNEGYP